MAKDAAFFGDAGVVDDLKLKIAELVHERGHVGALDRVRHLVSFLDRVGCDRFERLIAVPAAASLRIAQALHNGHQVGKRGGGRWRTCRGHAHLQVR
jgi:hypothetical protein